MITLISKTGDQKLSVQDYDESKTNVRYKAVINDAQLAVLHLQTVDTEDTPDISHLSLCPGVLESEVLHLLSQSPVSNTLVCVMFLIEKLQTDIQSVWSTSISRTFPRSYYSVSYAIKNQLVASKAPYLGLFACSSLVLYGIRAPIIGPFRAWKPTILMP